MAPERDDLRGAPRVPPPAFTVAWREEVVLRDGTPIALRLIAASDKPLFRGGFERLSAASRELRFLRDKRSIDAEELRYLTELDHLHHLAIGAVTVAVDGVLEAGIAVARFIRDPRAPATAEAALAVVDEFQQRGVGTLLFRRLCDAATEREIEYLVCHLSPANAGMRRILEAVDPASHSYTEAGVETVTVSLAPTRCYA